MKKMLAVLVAVLAIMSMAACGDETTELGKGQLALTLPQPSAGATGFLIEVFAGACPEQNGTLGALVETACVGFDALGHLPDGLPGAPNGSAQHFSDKYFNLLPETYCVRATPKKWSSCSASATLVDCTAPMKTATVLASHTTEIVLISECLRADAGGLDVVATLNTEPVIKKLTYSPSKFVCTNTLGVLSIPLAVTIDVDEPEGDTLTWTWQMRLLPSGAWSSASVLPAGCTSSGSTNPGVLTCATLAVGNYETYAKACDPGGLCTEMYFPIHVSLCPPPASP